MAGPDRTSPVWQATPRVTRRGRHCPVCGNDFLDMFIDFEAAASDSSEVHYEALVWDPGASTEGRKPLQADTVFSQHGTRRIYFERGDLVAESCYFLMLCAVYAADNRSCAAPVPFVPIRPDVEDVDCVAEDGEFIDQETYAQWQHCEIRSPEPTPSRATPSLQSTSRQTWRSLSPWAAIALLLAALRNRRMRRRTSRSFGGLGIRNHSERSAGCSARRLSEHR